MRRGKPVISDACARAAGPVDYAHGPTGSTKRAAHMTNENLASEGSDSVRGLAAKLGIAAGQVVQEIGYDDDCDDDLRAGPRIPARPAGRPHAALGRCHHAR